MHQDVRFSHKWWRMVGPEGQQYEGTVLSGMDVPAYPYDSNASPSRHPGECVSGWVPFKTSGQPIVKLVYVNAAGETADWVVNV